MKIYKPLPIYDLEGGVQTNRLPFLISDDSFASLVNAYVWRGRIVRRGTSYPLGRLRRDLTMESLGNTGASPWLVNIFTALGINVSEPDASLVPGTLEITITGPIVLTDQGDGTLDSGTPGTSGTVNYATGAVVITHTAGAGVATTFDVSYYPSLPVMGLYQRKVASLALDQTIAFDTTYAYRYNTSTNLWEEWIPGTTWNGDNADFFWSINYYSASGNTPLFWTTNFDQNVNDPIRYTDGTSWTAFKPKLNSSGTNLLIQSLILVPYHQRLVALRTFESTDTGATGVEHPQRARWSQLGDPTDTTDGWRTDIGGRGGFIDAPTGENIVSAYFIRDILIVGFETSTWKLVFTGNEEAPFEWLRVNQEYGVEATYADIGLGSQVVQVGARAITTTDGNSVDRIDEKIPNLIFQINNNNSGRQRVIGIRDYSRELAFWLYPSNDNSLPASDITFPNRLLVYNYRNEGWAIFTEYGTFLGYHQDITDETWEDLGDTIIGQYNVTWASGSSQAGFPNIILGNQQGYVYILNKGSTETASLAIQAVSAGSPVEITVPDHNFDFSQIINIDGCMGITGLNGGPYEIDYVDSDTLALYEWDGSTYQPLPAVVGTYIGGGEVSRVPNFEITSKMFSFIDVGESTLIGYIDFLLDNQPLGEMACFMYANFNQSDPVNEDGSGFFNTVVTYANTLSNDSGNTRSYHRFFANVTGEFVQFQLALGDNQINDNTLNQIPFAIHGITVWGAPAGRLVP